MNILAKDFDFKSLLKYVLPTILMMVFMSTYTIVDGIFVANFVGEDALTSINMVWPTFNMIFGIGLMFATGGTAIMGKLLGEDKQHEARSFLSVLYITAIIIGVVITSILLIFSSQIIQFLGVEGELLPLATDYYTMLASFSMSFLLQMYVHSFFVLDGKPGLGFISCLIGGCSNILLDYIFISPNLFNLGIKGAALATGIGNCVPAIWGIVHFTCNKRGTLFFVKPKLKIKQLITSAFNGLSEFSSQISTAITTILFNIILFKLVGKSGVASICVILYIQLIQTSIYFGYSIGVAPIISYKYGAVDKAGLKKVLNISFKFIILASLIIIALSLLLGNIAVAIFISPSSSSYQMACNGLKIFSIAYIFMGVNIFMSAMFTALSNGKLSAILSIARTLVFLTGSLLLMSYLFKLNGVWLAVPIAEMLAFILSIYCYKISKNKYGI